MFHVIHNVMYELRRTDVQRLKHGTWNPRNRNIIGKLKSTIEKIKINVCLQTCMRNDTLEKENLKNASLKGGKKNKKLRLD